MFTATNGPFTALESHFHAEVNFARFERDGAIMLMTQGIAQVKHARFGVEGQAQTKTKGQIPEIVVRNVALVPSGIKKGINIRTAGKQKAQFCEGNGVR